MVTLQEAARALADTLGGFGLFTVTEAPDPTDPDARRTLISSELIDEDRDPTAMDNIVVYAADGPLVGQQLSVRRGGYDATAGRLYTSGQFTAAPAPGQVVEWHARLPRKRHFGEPGLREVLNDAADRLWFEDELPFQASASTRVAAPAWLGSDRQLVTVLEGGSSGVNPAPSGRTARLVHDSTGAWLQLSSVPSGPFRVVARRPHRTWIKTGGSWGSSTAGLVEDDDETMAPEQALLIIATWLSYRTLNRRAPEYEQGAWRRSELEWEAKASTFLQWQTDLTRPLARGAPVSTAWAKGWSP